MLRVKVQKRVIDFGVILDGSGGGDVGGGGVPLDVQDVKFNAFTQALMP